MGGSEQPENELLKNWLGLVRIGEEIFFIFNPTWGNDIFQGGWNHQLDELLKNGLVTFWWLNSLWNLRFCADQCAEKMVDRRWGHDVFGVHLSDPVRRPWGRRCIYTPRKALECWLVTTRMTFQILTGICWNRVISFLDWIFDGMKNFTMKNTIIWENMDLELFPSASPINKSKFWVRNPKLNLSFVTIASWVGELGMERGEVNSKNVNSGCTWSRFKRNDKRWLAVGWILWKVWQIKKTQFGWIWLNDMRKRHHHPTWRFRDEKNCLFEMGISEPLNLKQPRYNWCKRKGTILGENRSNPRTISTGKMVQKSGVHQLVWRVSRVS